MKDYHPIFNKDPLHLRPSICHQMINTQIAYVKWDLHSPENMVHGARHRMAIDSQAYCRTLDPLAGYINHHDALVEFNACAHRLGQYLLRRKESFMIRDIPCSLEGANYVIDRLALVQPRNKIMRLRKIAKQIDWQVVRDMRNNPSTATSIFIKNEGYPSTNKPPRLIFFPAEGEKLLMSMAFYPIMHVMFSSPYCTKELPEELRPRVISKRLSAYPNIYVGDYTAWECVPDKTIMSLGEHTVLKYVTNSDYWFLFDWIERGGTLKNKNGVKIKITACQYSGRYTTSLSNTIRNKLVMDFVACRLNTDYRGVFEGDDSLTSWPSNVKQAQIVKTMHEIGVHAEISKPRTLGHAGYCSMWWNEDGELLYNPIKAIAKFPFSSSALAHNISNYPALLGAKAMSMAYKAPGCPITSAIVKRYISTIGVMETRCQWERNWFRKFTTLMRGSNKKFGMKVRFDRWDLIREPTQKQRQFFYEIFNIDVAKQLECERAILYEDGFTWKVVDCLRDISTGEDVDELHASYIEQLHRALSFNKRN